MAAVPSSSSADEDMQGTAGAVALTLKSLHTDNDKSYRAISHQLLTEFSVSLCSKTVESRFFFPFFLGFLALLVPKYKY